MYKLNYLLKGNNWEQVATFTTLFELVSFTKEMLQQGKIDSINSLLSIEVGNIGTSVQALITVLKQLKMFSCDVQKVLIQERINFLEGSL